jgi:hypothetical protein
MGLVPIVIGGAAAVTASPGMLALICLTIVFLLAMQMLLTTSASLRSITARFVAIAPLAALWNAVIQAMRRGIEATNHIRSTRAREWVRGLAITLPVLIGFALLLAGADPVFAGWRDAVGDLIGEFVPRVVFFVALLVIVLGAYGYASIDSGSSAMRAGKALARWLGSTERLMLLAGVAALFWLFLALQLGYLFGNLPRIAASGVTFAEYARRGFGELSVVASASALLIVVSERYGNYDGRERILRFLTFAVIAAVLLLLGSAFRRVLLYEAAYGFTTARLYAQVYMCAVAGLVMLSLRVARTSMPTVSSAARRGGHDPLHRAHLLEPRGLDREAEHGRFASTDSLTSFIWRVVYRLTPSRRLRSGSLRSPSRCDPSSVAPCGALRRAGGSSARAWFEWNLASSRARRPWMRAFPPLAIPPSRSTPLRHERLPAQHLGAGTYCPRKNSSSTGART